MLKFREVDIDQGGSPVSSPSLVVVSTVRAGTEIVLESHLTRILVESLTCSDNGAEVDFKLAALSESFSRLAEVAILLVFGSGAVVGMKLAAHLEFDEWALPSPSRTLDTVSHEELSTFKVRSMDSEAVGD